MGKLFEAQLIGTELKIGIVVGRFNDFINEKLLSGALDGLKRHDVQEANIGIAWVPGAFEVPFIAKKWRKQNNMMQSLVLEQLFAVQQRIMIMYVMKLRKASPKFL